MEDIREAMAIGAATLRPPVPNTETVAEITPQQDSISIQFPEKREDFRQVVRFHLGYHWDGRQWVREMDQWTGPVRDRAAEAGAVLLTEGFIVRIHDPDIRAAAAAGDYVPECKKWIKARTAGKYEGWFNIEWGRGLDFYQQAKRLPAARYDKPGVVVPAEQFEEVLGFAEVHGFQLSPGARRLIELAEAERSASVVATPRLPDDSPNGQRPALDDEVPEVPDDLRD